MKQVTRFNLAVVTASSQFEVTQSQVDVKICNNNYDSELDQPIKQQDMKRASRQNPQITCKYIFTYNSQTNVMFPYLAQKRQMGTQ